MPVQIRREVRLAMQRSAPVATTYDAEARTIGLVALTEAPIRTPGWQLGLDTDYWEILDMSPTSVDLSQVAARNCPLLDDHNRFGLSARLGLVIDAQIENRTLNVTARFGDSDQGFAAEREAAGQAPPKVSGGYQIKQYVFEGLGDLDLPVFRATSWMLREVSFTSIAADLTAGVRADDGSHPCIIMETRTMPETNAAAVASAESAAAAATAAAAAAAESARSAAAASPPPAVAVRGLTAAAAVAALDSARSLGVEDEIRPLVTRDDQTIDTINAAILERAAARQRVSQAQVPAGSAARVGDEAAIHQRNGIVEALSSRMGRTAPTELGRQYRGMRLVEMLGLRAGIDSRDPGEILSRAMNTTSDFPLLLEAAANKFLMSAYAAATPTYRALAAQRSFVDFKPHKFLRIGEFPDLVPLGEGGEIKAGSFVENREIVSLATMARMINLSRQMIVNDDLGAFSDLVNAAGRASARRENYLFWTLLQSNPVLAQDGVAMFAAGHNNLAATGAVISVASLGAGRSAMRRQKSIDSKQTLNVAPKLLVVAPEQETLAEQVTSSIQPIVAEQANPFSGKLTVVSDAQLAAIAWYMFADPADCPNFIYGYLGDQSGPMITQERPFGVDGVSMQIIHDFAVGALDYRGGYKNPGA